MKKTIKDESIKFNREEALERVSSFLNMANELKLKYEIAGSIRRKVELVGDVDLIAGKWDAFRWAWLVGKFGGQPWSMGDRNIDFAINEIGVNIRFFEKKEWGAGLLFLTGSKVFNIKCRNRAIEKGLILNQYDIWRNIEGGNIFPLNVGKKEQSMFDALEWVFVNPENRE